MKIKTGLTLSMWLETKAFAGNASLELRIPAEAEKALSVLFGEDLGFLLQVKQSDEADVIAAFKSKDVPCIVIGSCKVRHSFERGLWRYRHSNSLCPKICVCV